MMQSMTIVDQTSEGDYLHRDFHDEARCVARSAREAGLHGVGYTFDRARIWPPERTRGEVFFAAVRRMRVLLEELLASDPMMVRKRGMILYEIRRVHTRFLLIAAGSASAYTLPMRRHLEVPGHLALPQ